VKVTLLVLVVVPPATTAGLPEMVPVACVPLITGTLKLAPPRALPIATKLLDVSSRASETVNAVGVAPVLVEKFWPWPVGLISTNPEGVRVIVAVPEAKLGAPTVNVTEPEEARAWM